MEQTLLETAAADGKSVLISLPEDPGQAGKSQVLSYVRQLAGYRVICTRETGSKLTRALPVAAQIEAGNMALIRAAWNHDFIEELRDFPYGRKDDQVDALASGFMQAAEMTVARQADRNTPSRTLAVQDSMFQTICDLIPRDPDYTPRSRTLDILKRVLDGTLYDVLPHEFHEERGAGGDYIPLRNRRPSVRYALSRIVVDDSVALLFSEGHFPAIDCADATVRSVFADIVKDARLNQVMTEAAIRGSVGSVAILMRVLRGRLFFSALETTYLTPAWDPEAPDTLLSVTEKYKVTGAQLAVEGYAIDDPAADYWFMRRWDRQAETWFVPAKVGTAAPPQTDPTRTVRHDLGCVPMVWVRNLPGPSATGDPNEGACTFRAAIETQIEIDYQLSQAGRGLKYSSDPTLLIKEPATTDSEIVKGAGNALVVSEKGDAKLLEIGGTASAAVLDYVRALREMALESIHGNRASADRLTAAQSGRALELMNQGLVWLADTLRITYGEGALLALARIVLHAAQRYRLIVLGEEIPPLDPTVRLGLTWPRWVPATADDRMKDAQTLATLAAARQISRETAVKSIAATYDIEDVPAELARIAADPQVQFPRIP